MAFGFIKKVFTFGKDQPQPAPDAGAPVDEAAAAEALEASQAWAAAAEDESIAAFKETHGEVADEEVAPVADLPAADDPVLDVEMETAGGPVDDDPEDVAALEALDGVDMPAALDEIEPEPVAPEAAHVSAAEDEDARRGDCARRPGFVALPKGFAAGAVVAEPQPEAEAPRLSWFQRLRAGLARTSSQLTGQITSLFTKRKLDEATLQDLEDLLLQADLGFETAMRITDTLSSERYGKDVTGEDVQRIMANEITKVLEPVAKPLALDLSHKPHVILVVGVNGTGKTTTIGKLAAKLSGAGLKVMLAAAIRSAPPPSSS